MAEIKIDAYKRVNHFQGQFLNKEDFNEAHEYHYTIRQRMNYAIYKYGVLDGLEFDDANIGTKIIKIKPGMALDRDETNIRSREIILLSDFEKDIETELGHSLPGVGDTKEIYFTICYDQIEDGEEDVAGFHGFSRLKELAVIKTSEGSYTGTPMMDIILGKVILDETGIQSYDLTEREIGGIGTVSTIPVVSLIPTGMTFTVEESAPDLPDPKNLILENTGGGTLNWTATLEGPDAGRFSLSPSNGTAPSTIAVSVVDISGSAGDEYNASIRVECTEASNSPQTVDLTLSITESVVVAPIITNLDSTTTSGPVGAPVIIHGHNFEIATNVGVTIGGISIPFNATGHDYKGRPDTDSDPLLPEHMDSANLDQEKYFRIVSDTLIEATAPDGVSLGAVDVIVTSTEGDSNAVSFTVVPTPSTPTITWPLDLSRRSAPIGGELIIDGTNFVDRAFVLFNFNSDGTPKAAGVKKVEGTSSADGLTISVVVPALAITGRIKVRAAGYEVLSNRDFRKTL